MRRLTSAALRSGSSTGWTPLVVTMRASQCRWLTLVMTAGPPRGRVQQRFQWRRAEEVLEAVDRVDSALTTASRYE